MVVMRLLSNFQLEGGAASMLDFLASILVYIVGGLLLWVIVKRLVENSDN